MELLFQPLSLLFLLEAFTGLIVAQEVDPDIVDFSTVDGWKDLKACVQQRLNSIAGDIGCASSSFSGEWTNGCLCRPSNLGSAIQVIQQETMEQCQNIDDKNEAKTILVNYCKSKGYTSIVTPVISVSSTGGYTVTATVTQLVKSNAAQLVTSTVSQQVTSTILVGGARTSDALGLPHVSERLYIMAMWLITLIFIPFVCAQWLTLGSRN